MEFLHNESVQGQKANNLLAVQKTQFVARREHFRVGVPAFWMGLQVVSEVSRHVYKRIRHCPEQAHVARRDLRLSVARG